MKFIEHAIALLLVKSIRHERLKSRWNKPSTIHSDGLTARSVRPLRNITVSKNEKEHFDG